MTHSLALGCNSVAPSPADRGNKDSCVINEPSVGREATPASLPRDGLATANPSAAGLNRSDRTSIVLSRVLRQRRKSKNESRNDHNGCESQVPSCSESKQLAKHRQRWSHRAARAVLLLQQRNVVEPRRPRCGVLLFAVMTVGVMSRSDNC